MGSGVLGLFPSNTPVGQKAWSQEPSQEGGGQELAQQARFAFDTVGSSPGKWETWHRGKQAVWRRDHQASDATLSMASDYLWLSTSILDGNTHRAIHRDCGGL